jgi:nicotinamide-nucleotide adenylyltransferase
MRPVGLLIGRFQPFHLGHLFAVRHALSKVEYLYVAIGSAQKSHEYRNPFTAGERLLMVDAALKEARISSKRWSIIQVPDAPAHNLWVATVNSLVPKYDEVFTNDSLTSLLFQERGVPVKPVPLSNRKQYSATEIRSRMRSDGDWRSLLPKSVVKVLEEIGGVRRIKSLRP